jgi:beta-lactamase class D
VWKNGNFHPNEGMRMKVKARIVMSILAGIAMQAAAAQTVIRCTEMADAASGKLLIHEGQCDERVTPASTFKIAISLMGYDSGILRNEHAPTLPFRKGYIDWNPAWRGNRPHGLDQEFRHLVLATDHVSTWRGAFPALREELQLREP